jgi:nitrite reductase (NAD(P)H)
MSSESEPIPIFTPGIEPTSGEAHSPPSSFFPNEGVWGVKEDSDAKKPEVGNLPENSEPMAEEERPKSDKRKKVVVVGLGMVGIAFM